MNSSIPKILQTDADWANPISRSRDSARWPRRIIFSAIWFALIFTLARAIIGAFSGDIHG